MSAPGPAGRGLATLELAGRAVAAYCDGGGLGPTEGPRPVLHPVLTLGGTRTTDVVPEDHRWHNGVSVAVQDVAGTNLWGGRTYVRGQGYTWRADHGRITHERLDGVGSAHLTATLAWRDPDGAVLVRERRELAARAVPGRADAWALDVGFELTAAGAESVPLGSPATNGRTGAGYGGFFWRLPRAAGGAAVLAAGLHGEDAVHGTRSAWVAYRGDDGHPSRRFTLALAAADVRTARDPWFVRLDGYPGLGSMLAAEDPLELRPGVPETRRLTAVVGDGHLDEGELASLVADALCGAGGYSGTAPETTAAARGTEA